MHKNTVLRQPNNIDGFDFAIEAIKEKLNNVSAYAREYVDESADVSQIFLDIDFIWVALEKLRPCFTETIKEKDQEIGRLINKMAGMAHQSSINVLRASMAGAGVNPDSVFPS